MRLQQHGLQHTPRTGTLLRVQLQLSQQVRVLPETLLQSGIPLKPPIHRGYRTGIQLLPGIQVRVLQPPTSLTGVQVKTQLLHLQLV